MNAIESLTDYQQAALAAIENADSEESIEQVRIEFLGRRKGRLKDLQAVIGKVSPEERPVIGKKFNDVRKEVEASLKQRVEQLAKPAHLASAIDITLPGQKISYGKRHPITQTIDELKRIAGRLGFELADGPEIEDDYHNFIALNIPEDHPARDPLDNFYLATASVGTDEPRLLRSQTSTVQIRVMEKTPPPIRIVSLGRVYRPDTIDATHSCMFHQMEGLMVGEDITMANLKTILRLLATSLLGPEATIRFRPSFFPFTEPSVEVDVQWKEGWMEIGGAGMIDPNVLKAVGYDPDEVSGFAFGLGIERLCMKRHEIDDIRRFYENDVRFLSQF